jgi:hypothetical protein
VVEPVLCDSQTSDRHSTNVIEGSVILVVPSDVGKDVIGAVKELPAQK